MAAGSASRTLRAPGRIVINPSTAFASTAYPYGGTEVGRAKLCVLQTVGEPFRVESELLGEATDILEPDRRYIFSCFLRGWDDDAVDLLLGWGAELGATSAHRGFYEPGSSTYAPGSSAVGRAVILAYIPDDIVNVPGLLIYRGIPSLSEGISFQRGEELGLSLNIECLRNASGKMLRIGRMVDIAL